LENGGLLGKTREASQLSLLDYQRILRCHPAAKVITQRPPNDFTRFINKLFIAKGKYNLKYFYRAKSSRLHNHGDLVFKDSLLSQEKETDSLMSRKFDELSKNVRGDHETVESTVSFHRLNYSSSLKDSA